MLSLTRSSTKELAKQFRDLKARTLAEEGSKNDLDADPNKTHLVDVKDVGALTNGIEDLFLTTHSKGDFTNGSYSKTQTMHWHGEKTMKTSTAFQERPDGLVETLSQYDYEGDGNIDSVNRQIFNPSTSGYRIAP